MEFIKAFEDIDKDESGEITREELTEYMQMKNYKPAFVEKWLRIFDADNSGTITLEEFCGTLGLVPSTKNKETIDKRNIQKQNQIDVEKEDTKNDGKISNEDLNGTKNTESNEKGNIPNQNKMDIGKKDAKGNVIVIPENANISKNNETIENINTSKPNQVDVKKEDGKIKVEDPNITMNKERMEKRITQNQNKIEKEGMADDVEIIAEDPDITDDFRNFAKKLSLESIKEYKDELEMAKSLKCKLDSAYHRCWHVVVGKQAYGCLVSHEEGGFIHLKARTWGIMMWHVAELKEKTI